MTRRDRLSFPCFFDPNLNAEIRPIVVLDPAQVASDQIERWDHASVHAFDGTYGDYVLAMVPKVFPQLRRAAM